MIKLIARPSNAPCCVLIQNDDGRDLLIQTDYDFPGVASTFGWSTAHLRRKPTIDIGQMLPDEIAKLNVCDGASFTDGTIDCPTCGKSALSFINEAREWMNANDGATERDPGYFLND